MANAGPGTNGKLPFLVYQDSQLPPNYTVFGTIDKTGLVTLDKIAKAGKSRARPDGKPAQEVTVSRSSWTEFVTVPAVRPTAGRSYPPPGYPPPPGRLINALAIASLVCAFLIARW